MANGIAALKIQLREFRGELANNLALQDQLREKLEKAAQAQANATDPAQAERWGKVIDSLNSRLDTTVQKNTELAQAAGQVNDRMIQINEQVRIFSAGSPFEVAANALGDVGSKLLSLDFEGAAESSELLVTSLKNITPEKVTEQMEGLKTVMKNLGTAGVAGLKGIGNIVKTVGGQFLQLGKTILMNPIFIFAAVIAAIVAAIVIFLNKIGVLKKIMDAVGAVFKWIGGIIDSVIQAFKDLTDWLGLTNNAAEDAAQKQADAQAKIAESQKKRTEEALIGIDAEIKRAELQGKNTEALQRKKVYLIAFTAKQQYLADQAAYKAAILKGELDEKEIADLQEKARLSRLAYKQSKEDAKTFEVQIAADKLEETKKANEKIGKDNEKAAADAKKAGEDARRRAEEAAKERIQQARNIRDLELDLMEDGIEKELAMNDEKFKRLTEDAKRNTKITAAERNKLIELYEKQRINNETELTEKDNKEKLQKEQSYLNALADVNKKADQTARQALQDSYEKELKDLDKQLQDEVYTLEQYNAIKAALATKNANDIARIEADEATRNQKAQIAMMEEGLQKTLASLQFEKEQELAVVGLTETEKLEIEKRYQKLSEEATRESQAKKEEIYRSFANSTISIFDGLITKENQFMGQSVKAALQLVDAVRNITKSFEALGKIDFKNSEDKFKAYAEAVAGALQAIAGIASGFIDAIQAKNAEKAEAELASIENNTNREKELLQQRYDNGIISKEEFDAQSADLDKKAQAQQEAVKKKAFEQDKKSKIAQAAIAGITGAVSAFAGAMQLGPIAGPIVGGILAAAVGALTAVNISKIKSTQYNGGGGATGGGSPSVGGSGAGGAQALPSLNGQGNQNNNATGQNSVENPDNKQQIQVTVGVDEITSTQNNVTNIVQAGKL